MHVGKAVAITNTFRQQLICILFLYERYTDVTQVYLVYSRSIYTSTKVIRSINSAYVDTGVL